MTQASPPMVPVSHFWAVSQHVLRISQMCSWLSCCWFGPHYFSLIKPPNLHSFVRVVWNHFLGLKHASPGDRTGLAEAVFEEKPNFKKKNVIRIRNLLNRGLKCQCWVGAQHGWCTAGRKKGKLKSKRVVLERAFCFHFLTVGLDPNTSICINQYNNII